MATAKKNTLTQILGRMSDVEHQKIDKTFLGLIYGSLGTGKTSLIAAIAQALKGSGQILMLDSAQGAAALDNFPKLKRSMYRIPVDDPRDLMTIANALKSKKKMGDIDSSQVTVLLLDEVDSWFEKVLHSYVREKYGVLPDQDLPEIEGKDYNAPTAAFTNVINTFLSVENLHIIMVAHEQERGKEPRKFLAPSLPPKLMRGINEKVHIVARLEAIISKDGYVREVQLNPSKTVVAKTRIGGLPVKISTNDLPKIIKNWVATDRMAEDLSGKSEDPELVDDADVDTEEVETEEVEEEAVEVE